MATFVLVHGGSSGGWVWKWVRPLLLAAGHDVYTPSLPGMAEHRGLLVPGFGLDTHVRDVAGLFEYEDLKDVVLVGHSYAGMVITGVADRVADRLAHMVYLDAVTPDDGEALVDLVSPGVRAEFALQAAAHDGMLPALPVESIGLRWGVDDSEMVAWMAKRLSPLPWAATTERLRLTGAADAVPRTYIRCTHKPGIEDRGLASVERARARGWRFREIDTGHDAMLTKPGELAELLLEVVSEGS